MPLFTKHRGFTLAELLIALAILGEIATFTIPKILASSQQQQKKAVFKETIATFSELAYMAHLQGDRTYFINNLNAVKICDTNATAQGCWAHTNNANADEGTQRGYVLHNGATIAGFDHFTGANGIIMDWNGPQGPNIHGEDQIRLYICYGQGSGCWDYKPGQVWGVNALDKTMYEQIFN